MAKLETEINQIYLTHPENKKISLILYDEELSNSSRLFLLTELRGLVRKSDANDLKKISEIILSSFRQNKKLAAEVLFETALAQINQNLADLAHEGRKSWVGKFSCIIGLKSSENIYLANNGATQAFLLRKGSLLEILQSEKLGMHPLKSFVNFTQGKLADGDVLVITTSNIFNFISLELFEQLLENRSLKDATSALSKILKDSVGIEQAFCAFFLSFSKQQLVVEDKAPASIYAPLPEEIEMEPQERKFSLSKFKFNFSALGAPRFTLPKFKWPVRHGFIGSLPGRKFFQKLSVAGKFFFISFSIFLLLFLINLGVYGAKLYGKKSQNNITTAAQNLAKDLADAKAALIYKNDNEALKLLNQAEADFTSLKKLSTTKASEFESQLQSLKDQINKVSVVADPKIFAELKLHPIFLNRSSAGFLFANQDSNSLSLFDGKSLKDYFLLNSLKNPITGISFFSPAGVTVSAGNTIYHINQGLKLYEPIVSANNADFTHIKTYSNSLYALNLPANQVAKITNSKGNYTTTQINAGNLQDIRDFGVDKDIYLLYPNKVIKITNGQPQAFTYPNLTDPITNAGKIFVGTNLYILEPNKKRVVMLNKNGQLLSQIYFPNTSTLLDLSVDEATRSLYLLDDNKLYKVTF